MTPNPIPVHPSLPAELLRGYHGFRTGRLSAEAHRYRDLAENGQRPPTLLIGCCDSRAAPETIFDAGPGEIFVVRNIANLVPPFDAPAETAAAIEYAVIALKVAHIVIMGHAGCGGIRAFAQGQSNGFEPLSESDFIGKWKALIAPAAERLGPPAGNFERHCERLGHASIIQGLANLRTYPFVRTREDAGELTLHGACFGLVDGQLEALDQERSVFVPVIPA